ncbi:MAG: chorion class high-cysteine HCB protein 13 [Clostridium sp.]|uniref:chorion class high-cysteine HCB protein 13 n=1 Tax=Clostridium sp. TaxID=1506 RepID=UPI003EE74306
MSKKCGCNNTVVMPCNPCGNGMNYGYGGYGNNNIIWLILLLGLCGNNGFGGGCGCDDNCGDNNIWLLLILLMGCGGNGGFGNGFC